MNFIEQIKTFVESRRNEHLDSAKKCPAGYFSLLANEDTAILEYLDIFLQNSDENKIDEEK